MTMLSVFIITLRDDAVDDTSDYQYDVSKGSYSFCQVNEFMKVSWKMENSRVIFVITVTRANVIKMELNGCIYLMTGRIRVLYE